MIAKVQNLSLARANTIGQKKDVAVPSKEEKNVIVSGTEKKSNFNWKGKPAIAMYGAGVLLLGVAAYKLAKGKKPVKEGEKLKEVVETAAENVKKTDIVDKKIVQGAEKIAEKVVENVSEIKGKVQEVTAKVAEKVAEKVDDSKKVVKEVVEQVSEKITDVKKVVAKEAVEQVAEKTTEAPVVAKEVAKVVEEKISMTKFKELGYSFEGNVAKKKDGTNFSGVIEHVKKDGTKMELIYDDGLVIKSLKDGEPYRVYERVNEPNKFTITKVGVFDKAKNEGRVIQVRRELDVDTDLVTVDTYTGHSLKKAEDTIDDIVKGSKDMTRLTSYESLNVFDLKTTYFKVFNGKLKLKERRPERIWLKNSFR
jgi:hypothetical protein